MGRHTKTEVLEMGLKDLRAMSAYLGKFYEIVNFIIRKNSN